MQVFGEGKVFELELRFQLLELQQGLELSQLELWLPKACNRRG